ncbi:MAG: autotransporter-associated beta strand repeat-containing protein [Thermoguttaceae bacterium]|nr:autotransporter-associated beta strand repeat-containing protein [Thermoguttaceae bacterium]
MRYVGNETITTKAATGNEVNNTVANIFLASTPYTVIEKITVTDANENNVVISVKAFQNSGTVPTNLTELAGITWDNQITITSKASFDQLQIDMSSPNYGDMSIIRFGTSYGDVTGFLDNPQAGTFTGLAQRSIGLNFTGQNASGDSEKALATSDFAGADGYVQALWNNIRETTTTGVPYSMLDSVGSMEYYKNQSGYMTVGYTSESQSLDSLAGTDANSALMSGHANGATQVTLGAIPYDYYDVVVYMGDNADSTGQYWITDSEGNKISDTISVASGAFDGTWTQVKSSGDSGNYYVFRGLTTPSMILNSADGPINAVQIVGHNSTMYLADGDWSNELTVDGVAYQGVQFDSQTSADAKTASHAAGVVLNDNATFQVGNGYTLTQSAPITGTGSVDKTGEGTLVLSAANTYSGETNVYGGTLQLTGDAIESANGSFTVGTGGTLEYNVASGDERTIVFTDATVIGNGDILKTGEGRLKINTDELDQATADLHFTADNFVVASGRLDLEGYMLGNIEVDANTVFSPGNSIGEATFGGGYVLKDGATLLLEVGKDGDDILTDVLNVTGDTTFENGSIIKIALDSSYDNAFEDGDVAEILLPAGIKGGDGNALNLDNLVFQSSLFDLVGYDSGTGVLSVVYSAPAAGVPEPSTWALLLLGAAGLLYVRKRK